jgi:hypothetical protein
LQAARSGAQGVKFRKFEVIQPGRGERGPVLFLRVTGASGLLRGDWHFFLGAASFFDGRLAIALLEIRQNDRENEFLFAMIVEFDHDVVLVAGHNASEPEFGVIDLGSLREGGFVGH